jgi:TatD DNase family protein
MIIDTHIHLDDDRYRDDFEDVLKRAESEGVKRYIIPGADPKTLPRAVELSEKYSNIFFAVGVHPYDIDNYNRETLESYIQHPKCVAVGECGLDYYRLPKDKDEAKEIKEAQKRIFIDQIELANRYKKPLIVHIRDASLDSKEILGYKLPRNIEQERVSIVNRLNRDKLSRIYQEILELELRLKKSKLDRESILYSGLVKLKEIF